MQTRQADEMEQTRDLEVMEYRIGYVVSYAQGKGLEQRRGGRGVLVGLVKGLGNTMLRATAYAE